MNLQIYNGNNSQLVTLSGIADPSGATVSDATITATLQRNGVTLTGSSMTFAPVSPAGSYEADLSGFDAPAGAAVLALTGSSGGAEFNINIFCTIAQRSL